MAQKPRYRLATDAALFKAATVSLRDNAAHYLTGVLRLNVGDEIALFNRTDGEWRARIAGIRKKEVMLVAEELLRSKRPPSARGTTDTTAANFHLTVCFAPIKGGRLETIIEKATELGASVLQPVITSRTIVDRVNLERAEAIVREAAEQCERIDWPEIREPVKLMKLLGDWPEDVKLIYGDERGEGLPIAALDDHASAFMRALYPSPSGGRDGRGLGEGTADGSPHPNLPPEGEGIQRVVDHRAHTLRSWAVLTGPEGGFTPEEFAALGRVKAAIGVGLGPRILRADTAVITLCAATLMAWGDWDLAPRFVAKGE